MIKFLLSKLGNTVAKITGMKRCKKCGKFIPRPKPNYQKENK